MKEASLAVRFVGGVICLIIPSLTHADPVALTPADFDTLLGGAAVPVGAPTITDMVAGDLKGQVVSQAFTDGLGNYVYLYQLGNTGVAGNSVIEVLTLSPYGGASGLTTLGYLTANAPAGFTLGDQTPAGASVDPVAGPTVSFGFPYWLAEAVDPGEMSKTLYILSDGPPGTITGNIINGATASGDVVGPVPEPASMILLSVGFTALVSASKPRRQAT